MEITRSLYFESPGNVQIHEELPIAPGPGQVLVRSLLSAMSTGTEMLLYRGQFPDDLPVDENIAALQGKSSFPLKYGYSVVGEVIETGEDVSSTWLGSKVFAFQPHQSQFAAELDLLQVIPKGISIQDAVFLPNMETAINLIMDGSPQIGERVVVFGQGVVGLLTAALLSQFPLDNLITIDSFPLRRKTSLEFGASESLEPNTPGISDSPRHGEHGSMGQAGADLVYELTGEPAVLNQAISTCRFDGRVVIGSWYGKKRADVDLGGWFHRGRIKLISSQVSTLNPRYSGRWDKSRRFQVAWSMIERLNPARLITQTIPFENAGQAYRMLDQNPGESIQVLLEY